MSLKYPTSGVKSHYISKVLTTCLAVAVWMTFTVGANAGIISFSSPLTDDASTGISTSKNYTHTVSGGAASSVNGVSFDELGSNTTPANFDWNTNGFTKNQIVSNNGDWVPASGGVTGADLVNLLGSFTYSANGNMNPAFQTFTLSGLTPGTTYDARIYVRVWDTEGLGRPIDITFTNGAEVDSTGTLLEDRPSQVGMPNDHSAYYLNYQYTAEGSELTIDALAVDLGNFHLYALTNETIVIPEPSSFALFVSLVSSSLLIRRRRVA